MIEEVKLLTIDSYIFLPIFDLFFIELDVL